MRKNNDIKVGWYTLGAVLLALGDFTPAVVGVSFVVWLGVVFIWNVFAGKGDTGVERTQLRNASLENSSLVRINQG